MLQNNLFLSQNRPHCDLAIFAGDVMPLRNVAIPGKLYIFLH